MLTTQTRVPTPRTSPTTETDTCVRCDKTIPATETETPFGCGDTTPHCGDCINDHITNCGHCRAVEATCEDRR